MAKQVVSNPYTFNLTGNCSFGATVNIDFNNLSWFAKRMNPEKYQTS